MSEIKKQSDVKSPSLALLMLESRAVFGLTGFVLSYPFLKLTPRGDKHPVLVLPGLMASDFSTGPLRYFLKGRSFSPHRWRLGTNMGDPQDLEKVKDRIKELHKRYGQKVSVVGWSLGGVYARAVAHDIPEHIKMVITMGSPYKGLLEPSHARWFYKLVKGNGADNIDPHLIEKLKETPPVPFTSIYSKLDGIVSWQYCIEDKLGAFTENVEVYASHFGLGLNPSVMACLADRLSQKEGEWHQFIPPKWIPFIYP
jgi:pimeloyl-ACP methyl ester carboxylesterase